MGTPNTISDKQMADLARRGQKAATGSIFSKAAVDRRKANDEQRRKAGQS
jgi:hypothetical protein